MARKVNHKIFLTLWLGQGIQTSNKIIEKTKSSSSLQTSFPSSFSYSIYVSLLPRIFMFFLSFLEGCAVRKGSLVLSDTQPVFCSMGNQYAGAFPPAWCEDLLAMERHLRLWCFCPHLTWSQVLSSSQFLFVDTSGLLPARSVEYRPHLHFYQEERLSSL